MTAGVTARVDGTGRLVTADPRVVALQERAGGSLGAQLAVPQLASMARLARTLGILVSRSVIAADGEFDLDLLVSARPDGEDVELTIGGWNQRLPRSPWLVAPAPSNDVGAETPGRWSWSCDQALRLQELWPAEALTGIEAEAMVGQPLTRLLRLIEDAHGDLPILEAVAAATDFDRQVAVLRDRPREEVVLSGRATRDVEGRFAGFVGEARSEGIVETKPAEDVDDPLDLHVDAAFTERLNQVLRAPLKRIVAQADLIGTQGEGPLRRDYANYAGDIAHAARHLLELVDDLADLQAIERSDFAVEADAVDLADLSRRAAGLLAVRASDGNIRIDAPSADDTLVAKGDFKRVLQILVNLIGNAVRYSPRDGMVWIRHEQNGDNAVIIVADQGKGIASDDHERVFDKFGRVDPSEAGGTGLGLYIARRLARAMGGDIGLDSAPGQGARFILTLPATQR